jgi:hypothetical protein
MAAPPSGTTSFGPNLGTISAYALGRCKIRRPDITAEHLADAAISANLVFSDWSVDQPNLWQGLLNTIPLVQGQVTYTAPANLLLLLSAYITITNPSTGQSTDRIIYGVSGDTYRAYPNKTHQAPPTTFWFERVSPPVIHIYPAPDATQTYTLNYYGVMQDQDAVMAGARGTDLPYRAYSAFTDALAAKLSLSYLPEAFQILDGVAQRSYKQMQAAEHETAPMQIVPGLQHYYRQ